LEDRGFEPLTS